MRKAVVGTIVMLFLVAAWYLLNDDQNIKLKRELSVLNKDVTDTERLLNHADLLAPDSEDIRRLGQEITALQDQLAEESTAFVVPSHADAAVMKHFTRALVAGTRITGLRAMGVKEKDFYREHRYRVSMMGSGASIKSTLRNADTGPLVISWTKAATQRTPKADVIADLSFTVYSLVDREVPEARVLPACRARATHVWLPWMRRRLQGLEAQRSLLCARGAESPARTEGIVKWDRVKERLRSADIVSKVLRENRRRADSIMHIESLN